MRWGIIFALLLAGCAEKESAKLERQYEIMKSSQNTAEELCAKAREVAKAYLAEENVREYQMWDVTAGLDCNRAALDRL